MPVPRKYHRSQFGSALLFAIVGITLLGLLGMGLVPILSGSLRIVGDSLPQAGYLAESGITILQSRLRGLSAGARLLEIESLHDKNLTILSSPSEDAPPLGTVVLRIYPHWFQLGSESVASLPVHAGGCPDLTDIEHAFVAVLPDGTHTRFVLRGSGEDTFASLPPMPGATIFFVGRFQSASLSSSFSSSEPLSLTLTTATPDDFFPFPMTNGHIRLIDNAGSVTSSRFVYGYLRRTDQGICFEDIRSLSDIPLNVSDFLGTSLVLEPHITVEVRARTPSGSRDALVFSSSLSR